MATTLLFHRMAAVGTNSAEYRAIKKNRPKLVTAIAKQGGLNWFSQKLQEFDFLTSERASGITSKLGVSDEDKVSSLLEAVESKIKSNQRGTATKAVRRPGNEARGTPFTDFVEMLESEGCLQDMGQALQYECQMFKEQAVISGQIATSMSEAKPSVSTRSGSADHDPNGGIAYISGSTTPTPFPMQRVGGSSLALPEENTVESNTDVADGEEIDPLCAELPISRQQVDVTAPSSMAPVQQTSTLTRAKDLQDYVGAELSAIGGDITNKDSQISNLKGQLQKQLQLVEEQEKQITAITEENKKLETEVQEKREELTQKAHKLEECEHDLSLEKQTVEQLKQELDEKKAELESSREQLSNKEKEVDQVRIEKEKEIAELRKALEEKAKALEAREERMTELRQAEQQKITDLKLELVEKENELLQTQRDLARKGEELANTKAELTKKECMIAQLQTEKRFEEHRRSSEATIAIKDTEIAALTAKLDTWSCIII